MVLHVEQDKGSKVDIRVIQVLLGHQNLTTTARYSQVATTLLHDTACPLDVLQLELNDHECPLKT
jgi:integrase/recombinase XerD